jgi:6-phosphogluconolactonase (cycloisomerase 2 family)
VGTEVVQDSKLDFGIYPHQVMVFPSGRTVLIADRGNNALAGKLEDPGALRTFHFNNGVMSARQVVAPNGGYGFGPRHVSFHPSRPWLYVADERTNRLSMFNFQDDLLQAEPAYVCEILKSPHEVKPRQLAGGIYVSPNGRFLYVANRSDYTVDLNGSAVFGGGENNIAVFAIDPATGEPRLIQHAETQSFHVRKHQGSVRGC